MCLFVESYIENVVVSHVPCNKFKPRRKKYNVMKIKKEQQSFNFGATSELSKKILRRAAEKLNPTKVDGVVSEHAKGYLATFSNWATSQIISDELKRYQLPLPTGHQSSCPDAAGLKATEIQNGLFDKALQQAVLELREEELAQANFAEESQGGGFFKDSSGNLRPVNVGLAGAGVAMLGRALTRKKKKKDDDLAFDLAVTGGLGYIGGHGGAMLLNGEFDKPNAKPAETTKTKSEVKDGSQSAATENSDLEDSVSNPATDNSIPDDIVGDFWFGPAKANEYVLVSPEEGSRLGKRFYRSDNSFIVRDPNGKETLSLEAIRKAHPNGIPVKKSDLNSLVRSRGLPYNVVKLQNGRYATRSLTGQWREFTRKELDDIAAPFMNVDSGEWDKNLVELRKFFPGIKEDGSEPISDLIPYLAANYKVFDEDRQHFDPSWSETWQKATANAVSGLQVRNGGGSIHFPLMEDLRSRYDKYAKIAKVKYGTK